MVIKRPSSKLKYKQKQNLCVDKAYHSKEIEQEIVKRGYIPHIRHRREERIFYRKYPARRWVVEKEQIHGRINSGSYLQDMKRRTRTI
jgi:hypothetical protein